MSPQEFVHKWRGVDQKERSVAQTHFNELCELLGEQKPLDADPLGEWYAFEAGASKTSGGDGWADVWKRGAFAWEYKGKHKDLDKALGQVKQYAAALQNPPLLVACDIEKIVVLTNWTNTVSVRYEVTLDDLVQLEKREFLKKVFRGDESLRTGESRAALTAKVAREFAVLARELQDVGHDPLEVAHFVNRLVFCMFAEDAKLLADDLFTKMLAAARAKPEDFTMLASDLFRAMSTGGRVGFHNVEWFNGGLFDNEGSLPLSRKQIERVQAAATLDWTAIDPSILGTLFERGLDPAKRSQLGAHYTDPENIMRIVEPVVLAPLREEWEKQRAIQLKLWDELSPTTRKRGATKKQRELLDAFLTRLRTVRILDPACGSGNFLYLSLRGVKDLEHRVLLEAESFGHGRAFPEVGPEIVHGLELSPYAAELARVSIWIGQLQWQIEHGYSVERNPILRPLETIENRDALLTFSGDDAENPVCAVWPAAEFVVGNPPFIGDKRMREELTNSYTEKLREVYQGRVPGGADFVCYWFAKLSELAGLRRAGLVATQMIRSGRNNTVIRNLVDQGWRLYDVWQDEPWHDKGTMVRTSIVCAVAPGEPTPPLRVNNVATTTINPDLTTGVNVTLARQLPENAGLTINGVSRAGKFNVPESMVLPWLAEHNPHGRPNSDVLRPTWGADDLGGRWSGEWVIDFGCDHTEVTAARYASPFSYLEREVKESRQSNAERVRREKWWQMGRPRPELRRMLQGRERYLVTGESMVQRFFAWLPIEVLADHKLVVFGFDDDYILGILESRIHRIWARAQSSKQGVVNNDVYPASRVFGTFPLPEPTPEQMAEIAQAARELVEMRNNWLNPPNYMTEETLVFSATVGGPWHRWIPNADSVSAGSVAEAHYVRQVPKNGARAMVAVKTLTRLYGEFPAWLRHAHERIDQAVAAAYGIPHGLADEAILAKLLQRNLLLSNIDH